MMQFFPPSDGSFPHNTASQTGRCPPQIYAALKAFRPAYQTENGVIRAVFENPTIWRNTNEWAGYYWMQVRGRRGVAIEKFVWTFRHGRYIELMQTKPRGTPWRVFVG